MKSMDFHQRSASIPQSLLGHHPVQEKAHRIRHGQTHGSQRLSRLRFDRIINTHMKHGSRSRHARILYLK